MVAQRLSMRDIHFESEFMYTVVCILTNIEIKLCAYTVEHYITPSKEFTENQ